MQHEGHFNSKQLRISVHQGNRKSNISKHNHTRACQSSSLDMEDSTKRSLMKCTTETFFREFLATLIYPYWFVYNSGIIKANESKSKYEERKSIY